jgi:hypothetical protein
MKTNSIIFLLLLNFSSLFAEDIYFQEIPGLIVESRYIETNGKFQNSSTTISIKKSKGQITLTADQFTPNEKDCEMQCIDTENSSALKCSGLCSYGYPEVLTWNKKTNSIFISQSHGFGQNVPIGLYLYNLKTKKIKKIGIYFGSGLSKGKFIENKHRLEFELFHHPQLTEKVEKIIVRNISIN